MVSGSWSDMMKEHLERDIGCILYYAKLCLNVYYIIIYYVVLFSTLLYCD